MNSSGRGVLWFLGSCLAMTQAAISIVANSTDSPSVMTLLGFALLALVVILFSLLWMFMRNPTLLIAESKDVVSLELLKRLGTDLSPEALRDILMTMSGAVLTRGETGPVADTEDEQVVTESDVDSIAEEGTADDEDPDEMEKLLDDQESKGTE
jgi:hypothetical protein